MIGALSGWILSKTGMGKAVQVGILVGVILGVVFFAGKRIGTDEGKKHVRESVIEDDIKDWKVEKAELMNRLDDAVRTAEEAAEIIQVSSLRESEARARAEETDYRIRNLERSRAEAAGRVAKITDANLEIEIVRTLGIRAPEAETIPGLMPMEQRTILSVLTDYPIVKEKNEELKTKVDALGEQVEAMNDRIDAMETRQRATDEQRDLWKSYGERMDVHYRDAVNLLGRKKRSAKCLWIWKCTDKKLSIPTPEELQKLRPEGI